MLWERIMATISKQNKLISNIHQIVALHVKKSLQALRWRKIRQMETIFDANKTQGLLTIEESVLQATEYIEEKGHHCMQFKGSESIINGWSNIENENHPLFNFISRFNWIMSHCNSIFEIGKFMCYISQYCFFLNWNNFSLGSKNRKKTYKIWGHF